MTESGSILFHLSAHRVSCGKKGYGKISFHGAISQSKNGVLNRGKKSTTYTKLTLFSSGILYGARSKKIGEKKKKDAGGREVSHCELAKKRLERVRDGLRYKVGIEKIKVAEFFLIDCPDDVLCGRSELWLLSCEVSVEIRRVLLAFDFRLEGRLELAALERVPVHVLWIR